MIFYWFNKIVSKTLSKHAKVSDLKECNKPHNFYVTLNERGNVMFFIIYIKNSETSIQLEDKILI